MTALTELILAVLCYFYVLVRGPASNVLGAPKRVVVVQMAKLGDMVCTTPLFRAIKARYPDVHLTVVGNKLNQELLSGNKDVDEYIFFNGIFDLILQLRESRYDFGCITAPSVPYLAALFLGRVRTITVPLVVAGHSSNQTRIYHFIAALALTKPHTMHQYAPREYLRLLETIGIETTETRKYLFHTNEAQTRIDAYLAKNNLLGSEKLLVGVVPSAGHKTKQWFADRFAGVIRDLKERYPVTILLIAGPNHKDAGELVLKHLLPNTAIDACGIFSLEETKALISSLSMLIAVDTGPIYIAEAYGVPTVDIVGPVDEREQPPSADIHLIVTPPQPRIPQMFVMNARDYDRKEVERQLEETTVASVVEVASRLIEYVYTHRS